MVRNYKPRTNRKKTSATQMQKAIDAIINNENSIYEAAGRFNIGYHTLRRYYIKYKGDINVSLAATRHFKPVFTEWQESELNEYLPQNLLTYELWFVIEKSTNSDIPACRPKKKYHIQNLGQEKNVLEWIGSKIS